MCSYKMKNTQNAILFCPNGIHGGSPCFWDFNGERVRGMPLTVVFAAAAGVSNVDVASLTLVQPRPVL